MVRGSQILFFAVPHSASTVSPIFATTISDFGFVAGFPLDVLLTIRVEVPNGSVKGFYWHMSMVAEISKNC